MFRSHNYDIIVQRDDHATVGEVAQFSRPYSFMLMSALLCFGKNSPLLFLGREPSVAWISGAQFNRFTKFNNPHEKFLKYLVLACRVANVMCK